MNQDDKEELIEMNDQLFGIPRPILNAYCEGDIDTARELLRLDMCEMEHCTFRSLR